MANTVELVLKLLQARQFVSDADRASEATERIGKSSEKAAKKSQASWKRMGSAVAGAGIFAGATVAIKGAVDGASNLNESVNAVNVTFGKASGQIQAFSTKAVDQAGLSMEHFNAAVVPVGAMLQNLGYSQSEAATQSIELTKRAADMASVFNTSVPDAMQAIQAGLRGEADPLERFGVGLNDAAIKAQAMRMGLAKSEKALTAQDKAQARLALLFKQTDRFAGDFVNTSGGLANQQRILRERYANVSAQLGVTLIPLLITLTGVLNVLLKNSTAVKIAVVALGIAFIAYQAIVIATTIANSALTLSMLPWLLIPLAIIAIAVAFVVLYKKVEWFRKAVQAIWTWVKSNWKLLAIILLAPFAPMAAAILLVVKNFDKVKAAVKWLIDKVKALADAINKLPSPGDIAGGAKGAFEKVTPWQHGGRVGSSGVALVGERGPELVRLPGGANVIPAGPTASLLGAGGFGAQEITTRVYLDRREIARAVGTYTADQVARR